MNYLDFIEWKYTVVNQNKMNDSQLENLILKELIKVNHQNPGRLCQVLKAPKKDVNRCLHHLLAQGRVTRNPDPGPYVYSIPEKGGVENVMQKSLEQLRDERMARIGHIEAVCKDTKRLLADHFKDSIKCTEMYTIHLRKINDILCEDDDFVDDLDSEDADIIQ